MLILVDIEKLLNSEEMELVDSATIMAKIKFSLLILFFLILFRLSCRNSFFNYLLFLGALILIK